MDEYDRPTRIAVYLFVLGALVFGELAARVVYSWLGW